MAEHYRQQQSFSSEGVRAAQTGYRRLIAAAASVRDACADAEADAECAADHAQGDRFDQELAGDVGLGGADCAANADLAGALGD